MEVDGEVTAFPLDIIGDGVVNHQVGAEPVAGPWELFPEWSMTRY